MAATSADVEAVIAALENGDARTAVQLCNTLLLRGRPDQPVNQYLGCLRGLGLQRLGRTAEASSQASAVALTRPRDDEVLRLLSGLLVKSGKAREMVAVWESVAEADRGRGLRGLFFALCRVGDYARMQGTALALVKDCADYQCAYWAPTCALLQVACAGANPRLLDLALLLVQKAEREGRECPRPAEALWLHERILVAMGRHAEALALLDREGTSSLFPIPSDLAVRRAARLAALGRNDEARAVYADLLAGVDPDNWDWVLGALDMAEGRAAAGPGAEWARGFFAALADKELARWGGQQGHPRRAPFLAAVELAARSATGTLPEAALAYLERFGALNCCFSDLRGYIRQMDPEARARLAALAASSKAGGDEPAKRSRRRAITVAMVRYACLGPAMASAAEVESLVRLYAEALEPRDEAAASRETLAERQPGDDALLLACALLRDLSVAAGGAAAPLYEADHLLRVGLHHAKHNYHFKLMRVDVLAALGAPYEALQVFRGLDVKQILHESMTHVVLETLVSHGLVAEATAVAQNVIAYSAEAAREIPEQLQGVFREHALSKAEEFVNFHRRLGASNPAVVAVVTRGLFEAGRDKDDGGRDGYAQTAAGMAERAHLATLNLNQDYLCRWECAPALPDGTRAFFPCAALGPRVSSWCAAAQAAATREDRDRVLLANALVCRAVTAAEEGAAAVLTATAASLREEGEHLGLPGWQVLAALASMAAVAADQASETAALAAALNTCAESLASLEALVPAAPAPEDPQTIPATLRASGLLLGVLLPVATQLLKAAKRRIPSKAFARKADNHPMAPAAAALKGAVQATRKVLEALQARLKALDVYLTNSAPTEASHHTFRVASIPAVESQPRSATLKTLALDWLDVVLYHSGPLVKPIAETLDTMVAK